MLNEPDEFDLQGYLTDVFHPKFRRGYEMYLEEKRIAKRRLAEGSGPSTYSPGITDWENDAIVDEDDFHNQNPPVLAEDDHDIMDERDRSNMIDEEPVERRKRPKKITKKRK